MHGGQQITSHSFVVDAWSDRSDLGDGATAKKLATSAPMIYTFDDRGFSRGLAFDQFKAIDVEPGWVSVTAQPTNATLYSDAKEVTWVGFGPPAETGVEGSDALPVFTLNEGLSGLADQYTTRSQPNGTSAFLSVSQPGVHFIGIYGAWNGVYGFSYPKPENGVRTYNSFPMVDDDKTGGKTFQPMAIVTPWENGTVPKLPHNFAGPVHTTPPIPGDWRLALRVDKVTVFDGGSMALRCVYGPPSPNGGKFAFQVVEMDVPKGLTIIRTSTGPGPGSNNVTDVSALPGGGKVPAGYTRWRLSKPAGQEWSYENEAVVLSFAVGNKELAGKTFPKARIRGYSGSKNQQRSDNWQALAINVEALVPVPVLPKRLHTSYCWANPLQFLDDATHSSVSTWKALGFNTVPTDGASYSTQGVPGGTGGLLSPANRTGKEWDDMRYGIMGSPFGTDGFSAPPFGIGSIKALTSPPAAAHSASTTDGGFNFTAVGLTAAQEAAERETWAAALQFFASTGKIDLAYNGWFREHDFSIITKHVQFSMPDYYSMDIESFPDWESWAQVGYKSQIFEKRKLLGESDAAASQRFSAEWLGGAVEAAQRANPAVKPYLYDIWARYDNGYQITPWPTADIIGLADMPSYYGVENGLDVLAHAVRQERLAVGTESELIPWLTPGETAGTGGNGVLAGAPGVTMFNMLIQIFASGATGFNVYTSIGMYDGALWLGMRDAIAAVSPYEDLLCDGKPAPLDSFSGVADTAVLSAMEDAFAGNMLIASSTIPHGLPTKWSVRSARADTSWKLCDVTTLAAVPASSAGTATWAAKAEEGSVLLYGAATPCHK